MQVAFTKEQLTNLKQNKQLTQIKKPSDPMPQPAQNLGIHRVGGVGRIGELEGLGEWTMAGAWDPKVWTWLGLAGAWDPQVRFLFLVCLVFLVFIVCLVLLVHFHTISFD